MNARTNKTYQAARIRAAASGVSKRAFGSLFFAYKPVILWGAGLSLPLGEPPPADALRQPVGGYWIAAQISKQATFVMLHLYTYTGGY